MKNSSTHPPIHSSTFIIAEAGVNHNGDVAIAKKLVDAAVEAGADAIKFQTFKAEQIASMTAPKAAYQIRTTGKRETQFGMLKKLELSEKAHHELFLYCKKKKIMFLSTPFDIESVDFLNKLGLGIFKIPSGEITNFPYLKKIGSLKKKIIMSTGMADTREIEDALKILIVCGTPKENITLLHCHTDYPTSMRDVNLLAMLTIRDAFKVKVGYSDHTPGIEVPVAAVALGASIIEKHFTLDKNMKGPDHRSSLEPKELKTMVVAIRNVEKALGDGVKMPSAAELKNRTVARKSVVARRDIKKGERLTEENITAKRPGIGISPMQWDRIIGKTAKRNFSRDELIEI